MGMASAVHSSSLLFWLFWILTSCLMMFMINLHSITTRVMNKRLPFFPSIDRSGIIEVYSLHREPSATSPDSPPRQLMNGHTLSEGGTLSELASAGSYAACMEASHEFLSIGSGGLQRMRSRPSNTVIFDARCAGSHGHARHPIRCLVPWTSMLTVMSAGPAVSNVVVLREAEGPLWQALSSVLLPSARAAWIAVATPPAVGSGYTFINITTASPVNALSSPCKAHLQQQVAKRNHDHPAGSTNFDIVVLAGLETPRLLDVDALSKRLSDNIPAATITVLTGGEDLREIATVMSTAPVVIGLHTAALGYTVFSPEETLVVEITPVVDASHTVTTSSTGARQFEDGWDSYLEDAPVDREFGWREIGGLEWQAFLADTDTVTEKHGGEATVIGQRNDNPNSQLLGRTIIRLGRQNIDNLVALIQQHVSTTHD